MQYYTDELNKASKDVRAITRVHIYTTKYGKFRYNANYGIGIFPRLHPSNYGKLMHTYESMNQVLANSPHTSHVYLFTVKPLKYAQGIRNRLVRLIIE